MIKFILTQGIGFTPGSIKYIPTLGFISGVVIPPTSTPWLVNNLILLKVI